MTEPGTRVPIPRNGVDYRGKVVLAPMVRSGELPSRLLALRYGADLVWGPETVDRSLIGCTRTPNHHLSTIDFTRQSANGVSQAQIDSLPPEQRKESLIFRIHPTRESSRLIFQLGTASPSTAVAAAKLVAGDVAGIDVNSGCPKPFSMKGGRGAALLQDPDRLCAILIALVEEVGKVREIGISVKIRLLETEEKTRALVERLVRTGITGLTVHCRTTPMRPRERAIRDQLKMVVGVCRDAGVACVMNGDVEDRKQALELMEEFGADGAMIATAAEKNPSCFRTMEEGGLVRWKEVADEYMRTALEVHNKWANTKFLLSQLIPGKQSVYRPVSQSKSYEEIVNILGLENLTGQAREVDDALQIRPKETKAERKRYANELPKLTIDAKRTKSNDICMKTVQEQESVQLSAPSNISVPLEPPGTALIA
ncbi:MAG: hypothetical protein M1820_008502 [Bogoriella megaspora]|nr:MAG: hypothetical protein M1820_008502 [Bogoriella megaspora]